MRDACGKGSRASWMRRTVWSGAAAMLVTAGAGQAAESKAGIEYVDDIDTWRTEPYLCAPNAGDTWQGPGAEVTLSGLCFLPSGECLGVTAGAILSIDGDKTVRCLAGVPGLPGCKDGPASEAMLGSAFSLCPDGRGGAYILEGNARLLRRLLKKDGRWFVETLIDGRGRPAWTGRPLDGAAATAAFRRIQSNLAVDSDGSAYLIDDDYLRKILPDGTVRTLTPDGGRGAPSTNATEALTSARFNLIMGGGICFGGDGCLYVADRWNHCIRRGDLAAGRVSVAAGVTTRGNYVDGPEKECSFSDSPGSILYDPWRNRFYVNGVDDGGLRVWEKGFVKTICGGNNSPRNASMGRATPARDAYVCWCGILAVDPRPPHDLYFRSGGNVWAGFIGRLTQQRGAPNGKEAGR